MTIDEMRRRKQELGYSNKTISEKSGVPLGTVQKIFSGTTASPREDTVRALENLLKSKNDYKAPASGKEDLIGEIAISYGERIPLRTHGPVDHLYTIEDYMALPDDQRVELIDGVFYTMEAPTTIHQSIAGFIYKKFLDFVLENNGPCYPFIAPVDVQLDQDDLTMVQPDVLIVCDRNKYKNGRIFGAPDLIVEVLSPSTRKRDMMMKHYKYGYAGVREYWLVDPKDKILIQYDMEQNTPPVIYGFEDTVPVLIWGEKCQISLKEMYEAASFLWESE